MRDRTNDGTAQHMHPDALALPYAAAAEAVASLKAGAVTAFKTVTTALRQEPTARRRAVARVIEAAAHRERAAPWSPWEAMAARAANDVRALPSRPAARELPPNELEAGAALRDAIEAHGTRSTAAEGARRHLDMVRRFNEVYAWRFQ